MNGDARISLWDQFVLARAVVRLARSMLSQDDNETVNFCYTDTHAGSGRIEGRPLWFDDVLAQRHAFSDQAFFHAIAGEPQKTWRPGSWILAGRILAGLESPRLSIEIDVNDIDGRLITEARKNREIGWVRFWNHDWFSFLKSRLALSTPPSFVFVDPPPDDARGPGYAIDAAILLDTLSIPYLITYAANAAQDAINQIGRTGLELAVPDGGCGVLLGGGAENVLLDILPELRLMAHILGGRFVPRLPTNIDYTI